MINIKKKTTKDGFKIISVSELPSDDSDVSDAFEESNDKVKFQKDNCLFSKVPKNKKKKVLLFIEEFGLQNRFFVDSSQKIKEGNCESTNVIDYSKKRRIHIKSVPVSSGDPQKKKCNDVGSIKKQFNKESYEVFKLGLSGFAKKDFKKAKTNLVLKLGAKPPKNTNHNYKYYMTMKACQKKKEEENKQNRPSGGLMFKDKKKKKKKKQKNANTTEKSSALKVLSRSDVKRIRKS